MDGQRPLLLLHGLMGKRTGRPGWLPSLETLGKQAQRTSKLSLQTAKWLVLSAEWLVLSAESCVCESAKYGLLPAKWLVLLSAEG